MLPDDGPRPAPASVADDPALSIVVPGPTIGLRVLWIC